MADTQILQFGTSRFLLAHADFFVSQALDRGEAIGSIFVVQTTDNPQSIARVEALSSGRPYPVRIRGQIDGATVDEEFEAKAIVGAARATVDWPRIRSAAMHASVILSNTGERGYDLDERDTPELLAEYDRTPRSFPAKLLMLLHERWQKHPDADISIFPCELIHRNGDMLKAILSDLATSWDAEPGFLTYLDRRCRFANSLVDRIVSEPIEPAGAVAEPYALWAIEAQEGLTLPCRHPAIVVTDDLGRYEDLKLHILNLGHTFLAGKWLDGKRRADETVREIMADPQIRPQLEDVWREEVLPVFVAERLGDEARNYISSVRDRFLNPYLAHRLSDIASNHAEKTARRIGPVIARADKLGLAIPQPHLKAAVRLIASSSQGA